MAILPSGTRQSNALSRTASEVRDSLGRTKHCLSLWLDVSGPDHLAHLSVSSMTSLLNPATDMGIGTPLKSASLTLILRSARPALISLLSTSMFSGVSSWTRPIPNHDVA